MLKSIVYVTLIAYINLSEAISFHFINGFVLEL
jgi:hypothetical protein